MSDALAFGFFISDDVRLSDMGIIGLRTAWWCVVALGTLVMPALAGNKDFRIIQADASGITLEYTPVYLAPSDMKSNGFEFARYRFQGNMITRHQIPGSPQTDIRSVLLRFPGRHQNSVEVVKAEYEDIPNVVLQPVPNARKAEGFLSQVYKMDAKAYQHDEFMPGQIASLANIGETQGVILGELRLSPLRYNPGQRLLRKYSRIVVRVSFGSVEPTISTPGRMAHGLALNDEAFATAVAEPTRAGAGTFHNSVLASGVWFRFPVTEDGMYKLTGRQMLDAGVPSAVDPHAVRIFGNGGYELPRGPATRVRYDDDLVENAVEVVDGNSNNQLDPDDFIVFYGKGARGWNYDSKSKTFSHYINHYSETNVYWLTYGTTAAKIMTPVASLTQPATLHPATVGGKLFREDEKVNILGSGIEWLGQSFISGDNITYLHAFPTIDASQPVHYRFRLGARSPESSVFTVDDHSTRLLTQNYDGTDVDGDFYYGSNQFVSLVSDVYRSTFPANDGQSILHFGFSTSSQTGIGYIDWYEIFYRQFLNAQNNEFDFHSEDVSGVTEYDVTGFTDNQVYVFDVTRFDSVIRISNPVVAADTCSFRVSLSAGSVREFYEVGQSGFKIPGSLVRVANQNLHGDTTGTDLIIITHSDFKSAAQRLQVLHQSQDSLRAAVVDVDSIYSEFGGGLASPVAIRNYIRYAYPLRRPLYLLLFGDGDYDYKRILTNGPNWMPPWESDESFVPINSYCSDDFFGIIDSSGRMRVGIGRLTARNQQDANAMVAKIIEYESNPIADPWKIRVTFVADDGPAGVGVNDGFIHTSQAEAISLLLQPVFEQEKIYLYEYPTVEVAVGRRKPEVNAAIRDQINQGTLVLNYTGHGNPQLWAHEDVFDRDADFALLHNKRKYFFLVAATCNFSYFDNETEQSGGEVLVSMPDAGAVAVFSSTRAVYSYDNFLLNETVYENLFQVDSTAGQILQQRLGDVVYRTKQVFADTINDRKYFLLGDPAMRISFPKLFATIDTLNGSPLANPAQLKALSQNRLVATLQPPALNATYSGQNQLVVYDANRTVQLYDPEIGYSSFSKAGNILFRGEQTVNNGVVKAGFVVPKDISYRDDFGRITIYFWNALEDGAGYTTKIRVGGSDSTAPVDMQGPSVSLYLDSRTFRPGDVVSANPILIADLKDEHGINTSDAGVGHRIEAWIDKSPQSIDLTNYYKSNVDTYQEGTVQFQLNGLSEGSHSLQLRAWDTYNNPSTSQTTFDVVTGVGLKLSNVYNYPNPFSSSTIFTFEHNQLVAVDAQVNIYTVAGRLIQSLKQTDIHQIVNIQWDGRDRDGDRIANGVYLYKVIAKTADGRFLTEALGKLSVVR